MTSKSKYKIEEYIGKVYGDLEILRDSGIRRSSDKIVICKCHYCGGEHEGYFNKLIHGIYTNCKKRHIKRERRDVNEYIGKVYGDKEIIREVNTGRPGIHILVRCKCGRESIMTLSDIVGGKGWTCIYCHNAKKKTHGLGDTRLHNIWAGMKDRCHNANSKDYKRYGGRGIKVCDEWKDDFMAFYNWAMSNGYADNLTIDRIDVNGNYEPSNCRWADSVQQARNKRKNPKNKTGYEGVYQKPSGRWGVRIGTNYRNKNGTRIGTYIGTFDTKKEAVEAKNKYIIEHNLGYKIEEYKDE